MAVALRIALGVGYSWDSSARVNLRIRSEVENEKNKCRVSVLR